MSKNGQYPVADQTQPDGPNSSLDVYEQVINESVHDEAFDQANLGLGVYSDREYWQQAESIRRGLFERNAFGRKIEERAVEEAKRGKALEEWRGLSESAKERKNRQEYLRERGEEIWNEELSDEQRSEALAEHAGMSQQWTPTFWRMSYARHELSRSKDGRLIDNIFGRVRENVHRASEQAKDTLAKLGSGGQKR